MRPGVSKRRAATRRNGRSGRACSLFPLLREATLKARVITDRTATFKRGAPGVDRWRPTQKSPLAGFYLAGDWTATGWPATMEGADRSGNLAAAALLADQP